MENFSLELKQIVQFPRCRLYRQFIRALMEDRSIRVSGGAGLFSFAVLSSYANFRTSYRRVDGINYSIYPGQWVCRLAEMKVWLRARSLKQVVSTLEDLQAWGYITYNVLGHGKVARFSIVGWHEHNTVLDYNAPCQKDDGFFFIPIATASELIGKRRCSEMDIMLDLWINTVYNDAQVSGSEKGPVVYMRNGSKSPLLSYSELAARWGISKATTGRILNRLDKREYITLFSYPGRCGSVIYLRNYLSTMFQICDILLDKEEIALTLNICYTREELEAPITKAACSVSDTAVCVSNPAAYPLLAKIQNVLARQGFTCFECEASIYKLSRLSGCPEMVHGVKYPTSPQGAPKQHLTISCGGKKDIFVFKIAHTHSVEKTCGGKTHE